MENWYFSFNCCSSNIVDCMGICTQKRFWFTSDYHKYACKNLIYLHIVGGFPMEIKTEIRHLNISCYVVILLNFMYLMKVPYEIKITTNYKISYFGRV